MPSAETLKWILTKKFRGCATASTKLFEHLDESARLPILEAIALVGDEMPVVASIVDRDCWVLITTRRIIDRRPTRMASVDINVVTKCEMDIFRRAKEMGPRTLGDMAAIERLKNEAKEIELTLASGDTYCLEVESGKPYFGILNMLMHFADCYHVRRKLAARAAGEAT